MLEGTGAIQSSISLMNPTDLFSTINDYHLCRTIYIFSLFIVTYDWLLTLGNEVSFMWSRKFAWSRALYMICRYWTLVNLILDNAVMAASKPSLKLCFIWYQWFIAAGIPTVIVTGIILLLRIYAMYGCNRKLLYVLLVLFIARCITELVLLFMTGSRMQSVPLPPGYVGCFGVNSEPFKYAYWIPTITFESILFLLAIYKSIEIARENTTTPNLMYILIRDSVIFYGGMFAVVMTNCLVWAVGRPTLFSAFPSTLFSIGSILACRMLLNVQEAANPWARYDTILFGMTDLLQTSSSLDFVESDSEQVALQDHRSQEDPC